MDRHRAWKRISGGLFSLNTRIVLEAEVYLDTSISSARRQAEQLAFDFGVVPKLELREEAVVVVDCVAVLDEHVPGQDRAAVLVGILINPGAPPLVPQQQCGATVYPAKELSERLVSS